MKMVLLTVLLGLAGAAFAGSDARAQMADILLGLNHFPSEQEQATLAEFANDEELSEAERTIAGALQRVEHFPSDDDKRSLMVIAEDESVDPEVRELARITHDLEHQVGAEDRETRARIKN